jgi:nucleoside-diphosphate-sugar epimerase
VKIAFQGRGWQVKELTRKSAAGTGSVRFQLGEEVEPTVFEGVQALVHCAYDFKALSWREIYETNVLGTERLLKAAKQSGVERLIYISSISSFEGARSLYGKAKLEAEQVAKNLNAFIIRPGLIFGEPAGAMFGKLQQQVASASVLPLFGGGSQIQFLVHEEDLCNFICQCAEGKHPGFEGRPITVANEEPITFRGILEELARAKGKKLRFLPVPWRLAWAGIKAAELCRVRLNFRSDSLVSLMHQNPAPDFKAKQELGIECRSFASKA